MQTTHVASDIPGLTRESEFEWVLEPTGKMRVPGVIFATEQLIRAMDAKVYEQLANVATLPGIVKAAYAMPDAHWGYGFPIGGVAAFREEDGVISAGGVGFDISCGVRNLHTGLKAEDVRSVQENLASDLQRSIPAGVGRAGELRLDDKQMDAMLTGGAEWAVLQGFGEMEDLEFIEERGKMAGADPACVSQRAKDRQRDEMGTLGSGNHYLEVQHVAEVFDGRLAEGFGLGRGDVVLSIHCGSRGLGHQIGTDYLREMAVRAPEFGLELPDRELASAPIRSELGRRYLGAMRAAMNCAMANRQIIAHLARKVFAHRFPRTRLRMLYDVSHNTCKVEEHNLDGKPTRLFVHRKGATRSFGPNRPEIPRTQRPFGQPVLIGGSMGASSYVLAGTTESMELAFGSACHGAGRAMSRHQAMKQYTGRQVKEELAARGILVRCPSMRGIAEEAPGAYKDVREVVEAAHKANLAHMVARLEPLITVKG
jgi:tRNA-splicing ligase RtcB